MDLLNVLLVSLGINLLMFIPAYWLKTDKLTDISYAATFFLIGAYLFAVGNWGFPSIILLLMIALWSLRIGTYLLIRINRIGKDKRFDERRENFWRFLGFWVLQGLTVWAVLIPSILFFGNEVVDVSSYAYIGVGIWLIGLLIETFADLQKYRFINDPKNKGEWIASGLWKYSRHPNYFGEILLWTGVYVFTVFGLSLGQSLVGLVGPLYIALLISFVSGIPLLERAADKRWGSNPKYVEYKERTSVLIPLPNKRSKSDV